MTHPFTPPPELVQQWYNASPHANEKALQDVANEAAQWGADQELEACCEWLCTGYADIALRLRATRRPKPSRLKEQGLQALGRFNATAHTTASEMIADFDTIRRALEALPDD